MAGRMSAWWRKNNRNSRLTGKPGSLRIWEDLLVGTRRWTAARYDTWVSIALEPLLS